MKKAFYLLVNLLLFSQLALAQNTLIQPGVILPQMTTSQRTSIANVINGMLVFDTNTQSYWFRQNGAWEELPKGGSSSNYWELNGLTGNEIKNTNSGGFWSANPTTVTGLNASIATPVNGEGTRMMWLPYASAFRVGTVNNNFSDESTWWDTPNIGLYSVGIGHNTKANASGAISIGFNLSATGSSSIAMGAFSEARGLNSLAIGNAAIAENWRSLAIGSEADALGNHSTAIGYGTYAPALGSVSVGSFNEVAGYIDPTIANSSDRIFQIGNGNSGFRSNAVTVLRNGNVGIGTVAPAYKLHVVGNSYTLGNVYVSNDLTAYGGLSITSNSYLYGNVSVGGGTASAPLHVHSFNNLSSGTPTAYWFGASYSSGTLINPITNGSWATGLLVDYDIVGKRSIVSVQTITTSDARIKNIIGLSNNQQDLAKVRQIQITDYRYKDVVTWGTQTFKKVIAQQIEEVYPQAVRKMTSTIPDIYALAEKVVFDETNKHLTISLSKSYDIKIGEKIEFIHEKDGKIKAEVIEVSGNSFTVKDWQYPTNKIFVYGREVNDFRTVDYEAISMLGISAIQQLAKENEALKSKFTTENDLLKKQISDLTSRFEHLEAMMTKEIKTIEKLNN